MTAKEEAIKRLKKSIERKKEWERKFEERFAGVEAVRNRLFLKWFEEYADNKRFYFRTAHATIEGEGFHAAIIAENSNPNIELIKQDFENTARELAKP